MRIDELDYELPAGLIAQTPVEPRDAARLLVFRRSAGTIAHRRFRDLPDLLQDGDVLVRNDTRVIAARTHFVRQTGGRLELLFLEPVGPAPIAAARRWEVLVRGRPRVGETLTYAGAATARRSQARRPLPVAGQPLPPGGQASAKGTGRGLTEEWRVTVEERLGGGRWVVASAAAEPVLALLERAGETPLPPYIRSRLVDRERYQTTYAEAAGSAAAPTAGLHFTRALDARLRGRGVQLESFTLHVGLGTFQPITAAEVEAHELHSERYEVDEATWQRIREAHDEGRRIIAVGTTMTRLLETLARDDDAGKPSGERGLSAARRTDVRGAWAGAAAPRRGRTRLYITPGFEFRIVGGLITNFHLPRTSLLALVMAFCGVDETRRIYRHAVERRYRFYSFGDAMAAL
jgi:S-adenosylmethionine:tRNA ribosyltransferase-isomerase